MERDGLKVSGANSGERSLSNLSLNYLESLNHHCQKIGIYGIGLKLTKVKDYHATNIEHEGKFG